MTRAATCAQVLEHAGAPLRPGALRGARPGALVAHGLQLYRALAWLHDEACVAHRDVKPENVFVAGAGGDGAPPPVVKLGCARAGRGRGVCAPSAVCLGCDVVPSRSAGGGVGGGGSHTRCRPRPQ